MNVKKPLNNHVATLPSETGSASVYFDVDGMLGHVAKWLRVLGWDAAYPCEKPRPGRWFVTASKRLKGAGIIVVSAEKGFEQLREILEQTGVRVDPALIFSRCIVCNTSVREISRELVAERVPHAIYQMVSSFCYCDGCGRIYWEGSHLTRVQKRLKEFFNL